jgi:hypothetical protein
MQSGRQEFDYGERDFDSLMLQRATCSRNYCAGICRPSKRANSAVDIEPSCLTN